MSVISPYGSWKSPITTDLIVADAVRLGQVKLDRQGVYWLEGRPAEAGRYVIVRQTPDGRIEDVLPAPFNARTRVHEYGGGSYLVRDGVVYFSNFSDQRLYRLRPGDAPQPITPEADLRYADYVIDPSGQWLIAVREDHRAAGREAVNTLVAINLEQGGEGQILASGYDFYAAPRLSPNGSRLAWLAWNHPNMPWDGAELWVGEFYADGALGSAERVAGALDESIFQPEWSPDGALHFISDRTGWWNLYRWRDGRAEPLAEMEAEFGEPLWVLGASTYAFLSPTRLLCMYLRQGSDTLAILDTASRRLEPLDTPYTSIAYVRAAHDKAWFVGGSPSEPLSVVELDLASRQSQVLRRSSPVIISPGHLSQPEALEFPTAGGLTAYAFYYPPHNADFAAPPSERPPLLVLSHGGPTSFASSTLDAEIQFWTSRGFAVVDVNYGGSTGYGRAYRQRLDGRWGIVDVEDCENAARYLVAQGQADGKRLAIRGGSAGGYTTLAALTFGDLFSAGASYYGISDMEALATDTHKFESRSCDRMIGPYPERRDVYVERSPIHFVDRLSCPIILFQGLEDQVVPPAQAERMLAAARQNGLPVAYLAFEGEQHGFRLAATIKRTLEAELYFYSKVFKFNLAEPVEPVEIENLVA